MLEIEIDNTTFTAELHEDHAPDSVAAVRDFLPLTSELMHVRWSGIATWINIDGSSCRRFHERTTLSIPHGVTSCSTLAIVTNRKSSFLVVRHVSRAQPENLPATISQRSTRQLKNSNK